MTDEKASFEQLDLRRYDLIDIRRCGEAWREMKQEIDGDWVGYDDVRLAFRFIGGYLDAHCAMLADQGAHPKVIQAIRDLQTKLEEM